MAWNFYDTNGAIKRNTGTFSSQLGGLDASEYVTQKTLEYEMSFKADAGHAHGGEYLSLQASTLSLAGTVSLLSWSTGAWTTPVVATGKSLLLVPQFSHADGSNLSFKSAGLATDTSVAAPGIADCGGYAGWFGIGSGTGTFLPMLTRVVPASALTVGVTYYLKIYAGAASSYPLQGTLSAYWI